MRSKIAKAVGLSFNPVAILWAEDKPEQALQFKPGRWGCVMFMFANAAKGKTVAFDRETYGCWGGGVGLGFGNTYLQFPGGVDCFAFFLSVGNAKWDAGKGVGQALEVQAGRAFAESFLEGEAYKATPELVHQFIDELPMTEIPAKYVVFKPLSEVDQSKETPQTVVFLADADQLSALHILANYGREGMDNVIMPWAAGCQTIGLLPYREAKRDVSRAVVGLTDISARKYVRSLLGKEFLTFAMPWAMFQEMESKVAGSFLDGETWKSLRKER
ncbi:MAG: hypothetical protein EOM25_02405 [Deltaproteobacteria bacterium]|nr:hypothetical protein [Deltaproteobacteria bacterium]